MQYFLSALAAILFLPQAFAAPMCSDIFPRQLGQALQFDLTPSGVQSEISDTLKLLNPDEMAHLVESVAQNQTSYEGFSPLVNNALRRTLESTVRAQLVRHLAELPYRNELRRRAREPLLTARDLFGLKDDTSSESEQSTVTSIADLMGAPLELKDFGINPVSNKKFLEHFDSSELRIIQSRVGLEAVEGYLQRMQREDLFLNLGFSMNPHRMQESTPDSFRSSFDLTNGFATVDPDFSFWMFSSLVRERIIRDHLEAHAAPKGELVNLRARTLNAETQNYGNLEAWTSHSSPSFRFWGLKKAEEDKLVLILAAFPELLPFMGRLPEFGFRSPINFREHLESNFVTEPKELKHGLLGTARFELFRQLGKNSAEQMIETLDFTLLIRFSHLRVSDYQKLSQEELKKLNKQIRRVWDKYAAASKLPSGEYRFGVKATSYGFQLHINTKSEKNEWMSFLHLANFYLYLTK